MSDNKIERKDLRVGMVYLVEFEDCCVAGEVSGTFVEWEDEEQDEAVFRSGDQIWRIRGHGWNAYSVIE